MVAQQTLDLLVGVRIPPGEFIFVQGVTFAESDEALSYSAEPSWLPSACVIALPGWPRPLRLSVRTKDSQSLKRGSIPLGARKSSSTVE